MDRLVDGGLSFQVRQITTKLRALLIQCSQHSRAINTQLSSRGLLRLGITPLQDALDVGGATQCSSTKLWVVLFQVGLDCIVDRRVDQLPRLLLLFVLPIRELLNQRSTVLWGSVLQGLLQCSFSSFDVTLAAKAKLLIQVADEVACSRWVVALAQYVLTQLVGLADGFQLVGIRQAGVLRFIQDSLDGFQLSRAVFHRQTNLCDLVR